MGVFDAIAPASRAPAELTQEELLARYEAGMALVEEARQRRAMEQAREDEQRACAAEEEHRVAELFNWGPGCADRARARVELQERYSAEATRSYGLEAAEVEALKLEYKRREAEIAARWAEQRGVRTRQLQAEYDQLIADQKAGFDLGEAEWIMRRDKEKDRLRREVMSSERSVLEGLAIWERLQPRPARR